MKIHIIWLQTFIIFFFGFQLWAQTPSKEAYLKNNHASLNVYNADDHLGFTFLDSAVNNYNAFLIGEYHGIEENSLIHFQILNYLHRKAKVKTLVLEYPISMEAMLNRFVLYGDTLEGKRIRLLIPKGYDLIENIYTLNQKLPLDERIQIKTVDFERNWNLPLLALKELLPSSSAPKEIEKQVNRLTNFYLPEDLTLQMYFRRKYRKMARSLVKSLERHDTIYRLYLKENYLQYTRIIKGFNMGLYYNPKKNDKRREEAREVFMFESVLRITESYPKEKFMGIFGKAHVALNAFDLWGKISDRNSVASKLNSNNNSLVKGKVCSIAIDYPYMKEDFGAVPPEEITHFLKFCKGNVTLFKLDNAGSPYAELSAIYQYVIISRK